jgi:FkbM family methyltransferase
MGFKFLGNEAMEAGVFEPEETKLLGTLMAQTDHFVNVGANIGYYCCLALQKGLPVIAFEPEHSNLRVLLRNIRENGWNEKIEIYPVALSDRPGIVDIYGSGTGASLLRGWANTPVDLVASIPVSTLDMSLGKRLQGRNTLILIDIEGAEFSALQGSVLTLQQDPKPVWIVEICSHQHQPAGVSINPKLLDTFDLFWTAGYVAYTVESKPRLVERSEVSAIAQGGPDTLQLHNFMFIDKTRDTAPSFSITD